MFDYTAYLQKVANSPAWQRSAGKNPEGGLNSAGRASYNRETGGNLKAPVTEKKPTGERAKRQNSFCARMCGHKRKNTGAATKNDPDSRVNKALRKWRCKCGEEIAAKKANDWLNNYLKYAAERPGLWANIRAKRARGEKAARPGEKGYPDKEQWKRLTAKKAELLNVLLKKANSKLDGLLTKDDVKKIKTYVLSKNELREPRELTPEEQKRIAFRKRLGWSFFNPIYDFKARDVVQQIQNPMYRAITDGIGGGIGGAIFPAVAAIFSPKGSALQKVFAGIGAAQTLPQIASIKNRYNRQTLYNEIAEEYLKHHQEGSIATMDSILKEMTHKKKTPQNLQVTKRTVKTGSESLDDVINSIKSNAAKKVNNYSRSKDGLPALNYPQMYTLVSAPFSLYSGISEWLRGKKEINDIRDRFQRKLKDKAEAEAFIEKVRMPLYRQHHGTDDKIKQFDQLFKESAEAPLLEHQQRAIERLKDPSQPGLILMHGLGSGKTRSSIEAYRQLGLPAEVLVPASLRGNYEKEVKKWLGKHPKDLKIQSQQLIARKGADPKDFDGKLMVLDEAHRMRNADTKLFQELKKTNPAKRLLLTGTPIYNHPADIAKLINVAAGRTVLPENRPEFEKEYISQRVVFPTPIHRLLGVKPGQELGIKNKGYIQHVFNKMIDYHGGNTEGFPDVKYENINVPMEREQQRIYKALMKDLPWHLRMKVRAGLPPDKKELDKLIPFLSGARMISNSSEGFTKPELARSPKIERAAEFLKAKLQEDPNYKALVYSNYLGSGVNPYKKILDASNIPYGEFTGEINDKVRNELVKKYNENKLKALIVSSAGGEGLDLKGTRLVQVLEPHFNNEKLKQVIGRAARYLSHNDLPEDKRNVLVQHYLSTLTPGSIKRMLNKKETSTDEYLQSLSEQKEALNNAFINLIRENAEKQREKKV
jgi:SNF2 family DNA or RNA helicase